MPTRRSEYFRRTAAVALDMFLKARQFVFVCVGFRLVSGSHAVSIRKRRA